MFMQTKCTGTVAALVRAIASLEADIEWMLFLAVAVVKDLWMSNALVCTTTLHYYFAGLHWARHSSRKLS